MVARIEFTVYQDYDQYLTEKNDYDYGVAVKMLNEHLKQLVDAGELTFAYDNKKVKILLPVRESDTGNIFGEDDSDGSFWEGVGIPCNVDCLFSEFDSKKLIVTKCPYYFVPKCVLW